MKCPETTLISSVAGLNDSVSEPNHYNRSIVREVSFELTTGREEPIEDRKLHFLNDVL